MKKQEIKKKREEALTESQANSMFMYVKNLKFLNLMRVLEDETKKY